jgi:CarD family transcriptional regulator
MKASAGSAVPSRATATKVSPPARPAAAAVSDVGKTPDVSPDAKAAPKAEAKPQVAPSKTVKPAQAAGPKPAANPAAETKVTDLMPPPAALRPGFSNPAVAAVAPPATAAPPQGGPGMNDRRPLDRGPAPRAHAKQENFVEGDHVVYPTHGVGKVERIATEEIAGHKLELIHITFEENRMTLRVPVAKAPAAGLRKLATRKMFDEALAVLKGRARIKRTMWSRRAQEYEAKINSGDPLAIAEVVRDLHRNAGQPDQSFSERQIYEAAMDRLAAELAALDKTDKATASEKLTNFLKTIV